MSEHRNRDDFNREIDGDTSPQESAALKLRLANDPAARSEFEELAQLDRLLSRMEPVEPPAGLKDDICRAIRHRERVLQAFETERAHSSRSWFDSLLGNAGFRFAAALGVGAAAILLIVTMKTPAPVETKDLMGSLTPPVEQSLDARTVELPGVHGTIRETNGAGVTIVEIRLNADHPVQIQVLASPDAWGIESETAAVHRGSDRWTIEHAGNGVHRFALRPGVAAGSFRVLVTSGNETSETDLGLVRAEPLK